MTIQEILTNIPLWVKTGIPSNVKSSNVRTLLTWITTRQNIIEAGRLLIYKADGNLSTDLEPQAGDRVTGVIEGVFVDKSIYVSGDTSLLASYALVNSSGEILIDGIWYRTIDNADPRAIVNGNRFHGFPGDSRYVTGIVTDSGNLNVDPLDYNNDTGCKLFTDVKNTD